MELITNTSKVNALVESNPQLLFVLGRIGLKGSFGQKSLAEYCVASGIDVRTTVLILKVYLIPSYKPSHKELLGCKLDDVLRYLKRSHDYYLKQALAYIEEAIERLIAPCNVVQKQVIHDFYSQYKTELESHFDFEEKKVLPYISDLLLGRSQHDFSIDLFEDNHSNVEAKLSDLKKLILQSLPHECDDSLRIELLRFLFWLQADLRSHTFIEDHILVPMVRLLENPRLPFVGETISEDDDLQSSELTPREKEILVSVAKGFINKEIAELHDISIHTVISHRRNITQKIGIKTVPGLTVYAILNDLVDINDIQ